MSILGQLDRPTRPRTFSVRFFAWIGVASAFALSLLGYVATMPLLLFCAALSAAVLGAILAPELVLALFLAAGAIKAAPWLSGLPVDLTSVAAVGVLGGMTVQLSRHPLGNSPLSPPVSFLAGLTALILVGVMWSPDPEAGLSKALAFESFSLLAFLAPVVLIRSRQALVRLMLGLVGFGLLIALTAVSTGDPQAPLVSAGGNEIQLAIYSALGLIAAGGYLVMIGDRWWRLLWLLPAALLLQTVIAAGSRGALISTAAALLFIVGRRAAASRRARVGTVAGVAASVLILTVSGSKLAGQASTKYQQNLFTTSTATVVGGRGYLLDRGRELALAHPMGLGTAGYEAVTGFEYPHNIVLELADEQGILGLLLFFGLVVTAWRARLKVPTGRRSPEAIVSGSLIVLVGVESFFSYDLNGNRLLWFALGLAVALSDFKQTQRSPADAALGA